MKEKLVGISSIVGTVLIIWMLSLILHIPTNYFLLVFASFAIVRMSIPGSAMHYNAWYRCFVWSTATLLSLLLVSNIDIYAAVLLSIFVGIVTTGKCNISEVFMWKGKDTKYQDIVDFVHYNLLDDTLLEFENRLKAYNNLQYMIYKYRFRDGLSYHKIEEKLEMESFQISREIDQIALSIRLFCNI